MQNIKMAASSCSHVQQYRPNAQISADRAFWILDYYRRHDTELVFGGSILGEEAACKSKISYVWIDVLSIAIKLVSDDGEEKWDRLISMREARFFFSQVGDYSFEQFERVPFHSILTIGFPDGTTLFLAEGETRIY
jgi:hypothetical protein